MAVSWVSFLINGYKFEKQQSLEAFTTGKYHHMSTHFNVSKNPLVWNLNTYLLVVMLQNAFTQEL